MQIILNLGKPAKNRRLTTFPLPVDVSLSVFFSSVSHSTSQMHWETGNSLKQQNIYLIILHPDDVKKCFNNMN